MNSRESMRLFFALWPDPNTRAALQTLQQRIEGRLIPFQDLHLTLAFLGQQPASAVPALKELLAHLPRLDVELGIDRLGYFARNRIAWAGCHAAPAALTELHRCLDVGLRENGMDARDRERAFQPHITLARDAQAPLDPVFEPFVWRVREVALVQSSGTGSGPRYQVLAHRMLDEALRIPDPGEDAPRAG